MARFLVYVCTLSVTIGADVGDVCSRDDASCVEQHERDETAALRTEMLQTQMQTQKVRRTETAVSSGTDSKPAESPMPAVAAQKQENNETHEFVSYDSNGKVCLLCGKPLPGRVDREYKEFRTDCGELSTSTGPKASVFDVPAVQLSKRNDKTNAIERNGFCQLNFAKSCADAVANKDYLYWAKSLNLNSSTARANAAWDGRYCKINGFLETGIVALQHDFGKTQAKAQELCKSKYAKYDIEKLTFGHMAKAARYDDPTAPTVEEAEILAAWNCAMGDLGCDLALCAYSFCAKDGSSTGLYDECKDWDPIKGMPYKM